MTITSAPAARRDGYTRSRPSNPVEHDVVVFHCGSRRYSKPGQPGDQSPGPNRGDSMRVLALPEEDTRWLRERGVAFHRGDVRWPDTLAAPMSGVTAVLHPPA